MAKKAKKASKAANRGETGGARSSASARAKGKVTSKKLEGVTDLVVAAARKKQNPTFSIPVRALSNVKFNPKQAYIEMGANRQSRHFFDLNMAKKFMQTTLIASQCKQLIDAEKTASIRQLYYLCKHDVSGTKEKTFNGQEESDHRRSRSDDRLASRGVARLREQSWQPCRTDHVG